MRPQTTPLADRLRGIASKIDAATVQEIRDGSAYSNATIKKDATDVVTVDRTARDLLERYGEDAAGHAEQFTKRRPDSSRRPPLFEERVFWTAVVNQIYRHEYLARRNPLCPSDSLLPGDSQP